MTQPATRSAKTAVVLIHGMGEPRPLESIRSFVDTVYARDRTLAANPKHPGLLSLSIVPDDATGSAELRRITTHDDGPRKRTDFFEFYWADIMDGTPIELVTSWIQGLLLRPPWKVPRSARVFGAWLLLWVLAIIVAFFAVVALVPDWMADQPLVKDLGSWLHASRFGFAALLAVIGLLLLVIRIAGLLRSKQRTIQDLKIRLPLILLVAACAVMMMPPIDLRVVAIAVAAGVAWLMNRFVGPYFGDVVRYVRATPRTVEKRRLVRERGMALLEALHAKRAGGDDLAAFTQAEADEPPYYDRIVIVGHSLGSVVAYDLLQLFWEKHGPTHHTDWIASDSGVQTALRKCDLYVRVMTMSRHKRRFRERELRAFNQRQQQLTAALGEERPFWRITDLVILSSPLAHAEFLLTDSPAEVELGFAERRFAGIPPRPDPINTPSMLFTREGARYPHFAAQFAAVKWTNICDEHPLPMFGDLVSGRLRPVFGPGIVEFDVAIRNPQAIGPLQRIFTHTRYWRWDESYEDAPGTPAAEHGANVPAHIVRLREALSVGT